MIWRAEAVSLVETSRALFGFKHVQRGPARSALESLNKQRRSDAGALILRIDEELVHMPNAQRDEPRHGIGVQGSLRPRPFGKFRRVPGFDLLKRIRPLHEPVGDQAGAPMYQTYGLEVVCSERPERQLRAARHAHPKCFLKNSVALPQASSAALRSCTDCRCSLTKACSASYRNSSSDLPAAFIAFSKASTTCGVHQSSLLAKWACSGIFASAGFAACSGGMP